MHVYKIILLAHEAICENDVIKFKIPLMKAFGIITSTFESGYLHLNENVDYAVGDDEITLVNLNEDELDSVSTFMIYYEGIKNYSFLFPKIRNDYENIDLAIRLGEYYRECELAFEKEMWLSFILMCGGIFEGMLYYIFKKPKLKFVDLIKIGIKEHIISEMDAVTMEKARNSRNSIHANKYNDKLYSRDEAVEMKVLLDRLIIKFSNDIEIK